MSSTTFSIVIPTYNAAATLSAALDSILRQRCEDVEVIVVDGASKDDTVNIARSYRELSVTVISEPDRGIYDAMNKGIAQARGDLIGVLGADDRYKPDALSLVREARQRSTADIYAGRASLVESTGKSTERLDEEFGVGSLVSGIPFNHNAMFASSEAYKKIGPYSLKYQICADAQWVHRAVKAGATCSRIDRVLVEFGMGGKSSTDATRIMNETFQTIIENFPFLSLDEAEHIFRTVRGWSDGAQISSILALNSNDKLFLHSVADALLGRLRNSLRPQQQNIRLTTDGLIQRVRRAFSASC